jgi:transcription elongation GreA/GreB family factor
MSRGFVKEDDLEHAGTDVPERPLSTQPNYVTANGYVLLQAESQRLDLARRALEANKDEPSSLEQLAIINRDLRYISARIESAIVTTPDKDASQVLFGATVMVEDDEGAQLTYEIVGEDEADIKANKVSWTSPLAKALIGHKVADSVIWNRPAGNANLEIIKINY